MGKSFVADLGQREVTVDLGQMEVVVPRGEVIRMFAEYYKEEPLNTMFEAMAIAGQSKVEKVLGMDEDLLPELPPL